MDCEISSSKSNSQILSNENLKIKIKGNIPMKEPPDINIKIKLNVEQKKFLLKNLKESMSNITVTNNEKNHNAEHNTPFDLIYEIINHLPSSFWISYPKIIDHSCGKGNIVLTIFDEYYSNLIDLHKDPVNLCKKIIEELIYFADINENNIEYTKNILKKHSKLYTGKDINFHFNYYLGDSRKINPQTHFNISKFDAVFVNPPFEDRLKRNKTQHKLWIEFTKLTFKNLLKENGYLLQISPSSFSSPSCKILTLFREKKVEHLYLNREKYFKNIGTSICWYIIQNTNNTTYTTMVNNRYPVNFNNQLLYLPNDLCEESLNIHKKVMFNTQNKLKVEKDYVTCHNIILKKPNPTLSKTETSKHIYPVFHTNKQIWYSSIKQDFADKPKVLWTRSGYTKPQYDDGKFGVTDLSYFVLVDNKEAGEILNHNINLKLFKYILKTAKWSGFGNDKVFYALPVLPEKKVLDSELYDYFNLSNEERVYIENY